MKKTMKKIMKMNKHGSLTQCISNGGQSAINETNMNKINGSANIEVSAGNPATTHTHNRCGSYRK